MQIMVEQLSPPVRDARAYAIWRHGTQAYGDAPYVVHLDLVVEALWAFGEEARMLGYLHDVVEDTAKDLTERAERLEEIRYRFSSRFSRLVYLLTDERGANRGERKKNTMRRLAEVEHDEYVVLIAKAADRYANVRRAAEKDRKLFRMYQREHAAFRAAIHRPGIADDLWAKLDALIDGYS